MKTHVWLFLILLVLTASFCAAQPRFQTDVSFLMGFPQGEFADRVDGTGFGVNAEFRYRIGHSPVSVGGAFGFLQYGKVSRVVPYSPTVPELLVKVDTTNNILLSHFLVRYEFGDITNRVKPYAEGLVGFHYLWTQTSIDENGDNNLTSTNYDDTAGSFGAGGGVLIGLYRGPAGMPQLFRIDLDLGVRYLAGGEASYLTEGGIVHDDGSVTYFVRQSSTHLIATNIGVTFSF